MSRDPKAPPLLLFDGRVLFGMGIAIIMIGLFLRFSPLLENKQSITANSGDLVEKKQLTSGETTEVTPVKEAGSVSKNAAGNEPSSRSKSALETQGSTQQSPSPKPEKGVSSSESVVNKELPLATAPKPPTPPNSTEQPKSGGVKQLESPNTIPIATPTVPDIPSPDKVIITVGEYDSSDSVARQLARHGVIESWTDFNNYLISLGVERRIQNGNHQFTRQMPYQDIVKELMVKR